MSDNACVAMEKGSMRTIAAKWWKSSLKSECRAIFLGLKVAELKATEVNIWSDAVKAIWAFGKCVARGYANLISECEIS